MLSHGTIGVNLYTYFWGDPPLPNYFKFKHYLGLWHCMEEWNKNSQTAVVANRVRVLGEPEDLASLLCTFADVRQCERATRQDPCLRPPTTRTAAGQRSFAYRAACLLNAMPDDVRRLHPAAFKRAAKLFF